MLSSSCWICFGVAVVYCLQVVGFVSELQSYVVFKLMDLFQSAVVCWVQVVVFVSELQSYVVFKLLDLFQSCSRMLYSS